MDLTLADKKRFERNAELPRGRAYCDQCGQVGEVKPRTSLGMGLFLYKSPNGQNVWRWLHRAECLEAWESKYVAHMREHCDPEYWAWWQKLERKAKKAA